MEMNELSAVLERNDSREIAVFVAEHARAAGLLADDEEPRVSTLIALARQMGVKITVAPEGTN
jgi:hypothetical protein